MTLFQGPELDSIGLERGREAVAALFDGHRRSGPEAEVFVVAAGLRVENQMAEAQVFGEGGKGNFDLVGFIGKVPEDNVVDAEAIIVCGKTVNGGMAGGEFEALAAQPGEQ